MRWNQLTISVRLAIVSALIVVASISCSDEDDPISPQAEHFEAIGIQVLQSGVVILDYYGPDYGAGDNIARFDTLYASQGLNPHWETKFYNEDGDLVDPPSDADKSFGAEFADTSVAELWWHEGEEGEYEFHLRGKKEGETTVEFKVLHAGHADFTTLPISVIIGAEILHDEPIGVNLKDEETGDIFATAWLADSAKVEGNLTVDAGSTTDHIEALFFDSYGTEFWPGAPPHSLVVESSNETTVTITGQEPDEPWAFKLTGESPGSATITVYIYHDGSVGETFTAIPVTVN